MTVYSTTPTRAVPLGSVGIVTVVFAVERLLRAVADWRARRHTVAELRRLSPQQLQDIGLTPGDVAAMAGR